MKYEKPVINDHRSLAGDLSGGKSNWVPDSDASIKYVSPAINDRKELGGSLQTVYRSLPLE
jgi:hypothetical protein